MAYQGTEVSTGERGGRAVIEIQMFEERAEITTRGPSSHPTVSLSLWGESAWMGYRLTAADARALAAALTTTADRIDPAGATAASPVITDAAVLAACEAYERCAEEDDEFIRMQAALAAALLEGAGRIDRPTGMTLDEARRHVGRRVAYRPGHGPVEEGVITSVGHVYVFVRYGPDGTTSHATRPDLLELLPDTGTTTGGAEDA